MPKHYEEQEPAKDTEELIPQKEFKMNPGSKEVHSPDNFANNSNARAFAEQYTPTISDSPIGAEGGAYGKGAVATEANYMEINQGIQGSIAEAGVAVAGIDAGKLKEDISSRKSESKRKSGARKAWRKGGKDSGQTRRGFIESWTPNVSGGGE
jgi:hypothetical protein